MDLEYFNSTFKTMFKTSVNQTHKSELSRIESSQINDGDFIK